MIHFFDRLDIYLKNSGLNDNQITVKADISNGIIGKGRKRGSLSQDNISKILHSCPDLNANWLFTGKGEMLLNPKSKPNFDLTKDARLEVKSGKPEKSLEYYEKFMNEQSETISSYQDQVKDLMLLIKQSNSNVEKLVTIVNKQKEELKELREKNNKDSAIG